MNNPVKASYTREDYEKLPEGGPYQLIGGQLTVSPSPSIRHQIISGNLFLAMATFVEKHELGIVLLAPSDVRFTDTDIVQPDLYFIKTEREHIIGKQYTEGPPDLLIEILSPSTAYHDLKLKKDLYELHKVPEYWIVDPESKTVDVYLLQGDRYGVHEQYTETDTIAAAHIDGFSLVVKAIFPR